MKADGSHNLQAVAALAQGVQDVILDLGLIRRPLRLRKYLLGAVRAVPDPLGEGIAADVQRGLDRVNIPPVRLEVQRLGHIVQRHLAHSSKRIRKHLIAVVICSAKSCADTRRRRHSILRDEEIA